MEKNNLSHHGILGMKWGVRRYQNPDGSYTKAGLRRRNEDTRSDDRKRYDELKKKKLHEMSNKELNDYNNRNNLEYNYRQNKSRSSVFKRGLAIVGGAAAVMNMVVNLHGTAGKAATIGKDAATMGLAIGVVASDKLKSIGQNAASSVINTVGGWVVNDYNRRH